MIAHFAIVSNAQEQEQQLWGCGRLHQDASQYILTSPYLQYYALSICTVQYSTVQYSVTTRDISERARETRVAGIEPEAKKGATALDASKVGRFT
jgi:hypothetical protein